ncbi:MAG TPA: HAMP domain-containing protein, partial [Acidimicrobiia bacterium]|nr:HAMP domain-containing protein [Acidimicrobiia bacterium]
MSVRFGIRSRLTLIVTLVFTAAVAIGAVAVIEYVESRLVSNTRDNAVALLSDYLDTAADGGPIVATVDPAESGVFFYLDANGNQMTQAEYVDKLIGIAPPGGDDDQPPSQLHLNQAGEPPVGEPGGNQALAVSITASPVGEIQDVDLGDDTVAVAQRVRFVDGTELHIGVANSLQPVADSVDTMKTILWIALPLLASAVGLATYMTVGRTLRPVHSITRQTQEITATNLNRQVPVPESRDDIAELATTINDMLARLHHAQKRQRRFIADASHELRSPVAASQTQLEVALSSLGHADWPTTAKNVLGEQTRLGHLVNDLLTLTSLDEQGPGSVRPVDLEDLVTEETARPHQATITTSIDDRVVVTGNKRHLSR